MLVTTARIGCLEVVGQDNRYTLFFISTSNFFPSLAGAYFETDFGLIFTKLLPLFINLKCYLMKVLHVNPNRMTENRFKQRFSPKKLVKFQASNAYRVGAYKKSAYVTL